MSPSSRKARILAWSLVLLPILLILLYPTLQDHLRAASLLARIANPNAAGWIANYGVHPVETRDQTLEFHGRAVASRIYSPVGVGFAPGIVVVHGMHELGIEEPRLVNFARSLAASGFFVMTPLVQGIAEYRVEPESADLIGTAAQSFSRELNLPKVGVLCVSFSGGLALLAATDPQYSGSVAWIANIGAYYDLAHVLRFFATGETQRPDGSIEQRTPHEYGPLIVIADRTGDFFNPHDAPLAGAAIKLVLAGQGKESEAITARMTPAGRQLMQQIYSKQFAGLRPAMLAEIDMDREQLSAASPAGRVGFIRAPVLLLHGSDDNVIPPTELLWLKEHIPPQYLVAALISPAITHVGVGGKPKLRDQLALVHWVALLFREARKTLTAQLANLPAGMWLYAAAHGHMVTLDDIKAAQERLRGIAARTPLVRYYPPAQKDGTSSSTPESELWLKPESLQPIGSFKLRGAYNKIASLSEAERSNGVISYSSGNHAQGVAYAARAFGVKCVMVMPRNAPKVKMDSTAALGAEIVTVGPASGERMQKAEELAAQRGYAIVPPYNDPCIIAGQGTVGLEILEDCPDVELVLVPVGGGGLISGISSAIKLSGSKAKVIGVEPELANDAQQSLRRGEIVQLPAERVSSTLADGLRTQSVGPLNFEHIRNYVDDIITVEEDQIRSAMRRIVTEARVLAEPSGAVTFAAWLFHAKELPKFKKAVAVVSGGNLEPQLLAEVLSETSPQSPRD
jgi:threonine dehydratase